MALDFIVLNGITFFLLYYGIAFVSRVTTVSPLPGVPITMCPARYLLVTWRMVLTISSPLQVKTPAPNCCASARILKSIRLVVELMAVIVSPDEVRTEIVKAFIVPKADVTPGPHFAKDIKNFFKTRLLVHECPREVEFVNELPLTATGKIMRRELKSWKCSGRPSRNKNPPHT